ncbi:MAG: right-handed parallel beta-helix repeat-containing protein [Bacteroidota bacterium]
MSRYAMLVVLVCFALTGTPLFAQLNGTYTINNTGTGSADYTTFADAINDLVANGASGEVIFNVKGIYEEYINIPAYPVTASFDVNLHNVIFRGEGIAPEGAGQTTLDKTVVHRPTTGSVPSPLVFISGATNVRFEDMFLRGLYGPSAGTGAGLPTPNGPVVQLFGSPSSNTAHITLDRVKTFGLNEGLLIDQVPVDQVTVRNSVLFGQAPIRVSGPSSLNANGLKIHDNNISTGTVNTLVDVANYNNVEIYGNTMLGLDVGIDLDGADQNVRIYNNTIQGDIGIRIKGVISSGFEGLIGNNMVRGVTRGITLENAGRYDIVHNSVDIVGATYNACSTDFNASARTLNVEGSLSTDIFVRNNVLPNFAGGPALYVDAAVGSSVIDSDGNNLFTYGENVIHYRGADFESVGLFQVDVASGAREDDSITCNPQYADSANQDLHSDAKCMDGAAVTGFSISNLLNTDIDGDARAAASGPSDIGADEFTSTKAAPLPLGSYTVGGTSPDFPTFADALTALYERGIAGPVIFNLASGNHPLPSSAAFSYFRPVDGATETETITFSGNQTTPSSITNLIQLCGRLHMTFEHITRTTASNGVEMGRFVSDVTFKNSTFNSSGSAMDAHIGPTSSAGEFGAIAKDIEISNNAFLGDFRNAIQILQGQNVVVAQNTITHSNPSASNFTTGVAVGNFAGPAREVMILDNTISEVSLGITLSLTSTGAVRRNNIRTYNRALSLEADVSSTEVLVLNNMLHTSEIDGPAAELTVSNARVYHNTILVSGSTNLAGLAPPGLNAALTVNSATSSFFLNNLFINLAGGRAVDYGDLNSSLFESNHNLFYVPGTSAHIVQWGTGAQLQQFASFAAFQSASVSGTNEVNSLSKAITFVSNTDLHLAGSSIGDTSIGGTSTVEKFLQRDIDGEIRSKQPYMGADEVASSPLAAGVLPVELTSFDATHTSDTIHLHWTTASETNNAGFAVEMAAVTTDSTTTWTEQAFVDGAGTTLEAQDYSHTLPDLDIGTYRFRLGQVDFDGTVDYSTEVEVTLELAEGYVLSTAYPNPFNPQTQFTLQVSHDQQVAIAAYDITGRRVALLHAGTLAGQRQHTFAFDAANLASGLYLIRVTGERFSETQQVMLVK